MTTQTITTNKDCYTYEYEGGTNQNNDQLEIRGLSGYRRRTFIAFDITSAPAASLVSSVKIYLYLNYEEDYALTGRFNRIIDSWTETGITWNNPPGVTPDDQTTHSMANTPVGWHNYDITAIYKAAKNAGNECGIRIMDDNESSDSHHHYCAREGTYDPYILITYSVTDFYVKTTGDDSLNGESWTNAWKTVNKAATTVADGTTVHIGFGTYDAEPTGNKIAPQNIGSSGIRYSFEDPSTGGGTGTVTIEKN